MSYSRRARRTIIIAALAVAVLPTEALAQQRTDSQGTITFYDVDGQVTARTVINGKTATTYDAVGRVTSRATTSGKHKTIYDGLGVFLERTNRR
jgi:YD repeat-containing protein